MRARAFDHLQRLSWRWFDAQRTGRLVARVTRDLEEIGEVAHAPIAVRSHAVEVHDRPPQPRLPHRLWQIAPLRSDDQRHRRMRCGRLFRRPQFEAMVAVRGEPLDAEPERGIQHAVDPALFRALGFAGAEARGSPIALFRREHALEASTREIDRQSYIDLDRPGRLAHNANRRQHLAPGLRFAFLECALDVRIRGDLGPHGLEQGKPRVLRHGALPAPCITITRFDPAAGA